MIAKYARLAHRMTENKERSNRQHEGRQQDRDQRKHHSAGGRCAIDEMVKMFAPRASAP